VTRHTVESVSGEVRVDGVLLEYQWIPPSGNPDLPIFVLLHEGLGCVGMWKEFPVSLARQTERGVLIYSRAGYGGSGPAKLPRQTDYMHREGEIVLPHLIAQLEPLLGNTPLVLLGHSDGGSIALIAAGSHLAMTIDRLILFAPHVFNEPITTASIEQAGATFRTSKALRQALAIYHGERVDETFWGWNEIWLDPTFRDWNIEAYLPEITVPVLVLQGAEDEYGSDRQLEAIGRGVKGYCRTRVLPECGHAPHRDRPTEVMTEIDHFIREVR
jgi:pimeloyl-ACP methyl ester carboxylesterase